MIKRGKIKRHCKTVHKDSDLKKLCTVLHKIAVTYCPLLVNIYMLLFFLFFFTEIHTDHFFFGPIILYTFYSVAGILLSIHKCFKKGKHTQFYIHFCYLSDQHINILNSKGTTINKAHDFS